MFLFRLLSPSLSLGIVFGWQAWHTKNKPGRFKGLYKLLKASESIVSEISVLLEEIAARFNQHGLWTPCPHTEHSSIGSSSKLILYLLSQIEQLSGSRFWILHMIRRDKGLSFLSSKFDTLRKFAVAFKVSCHSLKCHSQCLVHFCHTYIFANRV